MPPRRAELPRGPGPARTPFPRGSGPKRGAPMNRHAKVNAQNRARRAAEFARAYGSVDRAAFVRSLPCAVCGFTPSENAHVGGLADGAGMGRKANADTILPLCRRHHEEQHRIGTASFEERHAVSLAAAARATERLWIAHTTQP